MEHLSPFSLVDLHCGRREYEGSCALSRSSQLDAVDWDIEDTEVPSSRGVSCGSDESLEEEAWAYSEVAWEALSAELWGRLARWLEPTEFVRLLRIRKHLVLKEDQQRLWRMFCHAAGLAHRHDCSSSLLLAPSLEVNWHALFAANKLLQAASQTYLVAWVRVKDEDIQVPSTEAADVALGEDLLALVDDGYRPVSMLHDALSSVLLISPGEFRLRELHSGRIGRLLRQALFHKGGSATTAVVEHRPSTWLLPPYGEQTVEEDMWPSLPLVPHPLGRGKGWQVELTTAPPLDTGALSAAGPRDSSLQRWAIVGQERPAEELTLGALCEELSRELPHLGLASATEAVPVWPASSSCPSEPLKAERSWLLWEDLRWTQSERLHLLEVMLPEKQLPWSSAPGGSCAGDARCRVVLFTRECRLNPRLVEHGRVSCHCSHAGLQPVASTPSSSRTQSATHLVEAGSSGLETKAMLHTQPPPFCLSCVGDRAASPADENDDEVPHSCKVLISSMGARQFEFHPVRQGTLLIGRKDGVVAVVDHQTDTQSHVLEVDHCPILGLCWLHTRPQWALAGASQSGTLALLRYEEDRPGTMEQHRLEPFSHLSSLSVNCTDDLFMTSGFCLDVGLYDMITGRRMATFQGLHQNFINILRFANCSPHLFSTASFDHTCKLWDLRQPISPTRPARLYCTDSLNVMCAVSPDDRHLLCSGVDHVLSQFSLDRNCTGSRFPISASGSDTNYRRSLYMAAGRKVATAATNQSLVQLYSREQPHHCLGKIDLRGALAHHRGPLRRTTSLVWQEDGGELSLLAPASEPERSAEYVQSLRCHTTDPSLLGALLATNDARPESLVAIVQIPDYCKERGGP